MGFFSRISHTVTNIVHTVTHPVQLLLTNPSKLNLGDIATLGTAGLAAPTVDAIRHPADAPFIAAGAVAGGAFVGSALFAPAITAEGAAPVAAAAGGAGGFATSPALTTIAPPDFALIPENYVAVADLPSFSITGTEVSSLAAEQAGTSVLALPPPGSTPVLSLEPANYVQAAPATDFTIAPSATTPGVLQNAGNSLLNAIEHPIDTAQTLLKDATSALGVFAGLRAFANRIAGGLGVSGGGGIQGAQIIPVPAGPGGTSSNYSTVGGGGSDATTSISNIGGIPTPVVFALIAVVAVIALQKKIRI